MRDYLDTLRLQIPQVMTIELRDAPKRFASTLVICAYVAYFSDLALAAAAFGIIFAAEANIRYVYRSLPDETARITDLRLCSVIAAHLFALGAYCVPGLLLVQQPYHVALASGFLLLSGVMLHSLGAHMYVRASSWLALIPPSLAIVLAAFSYADQPFLPPRPWDATLMVAGVLIWIANVLEVNLRQSQNRRTFGDARLQAEKKIMQLEHFSRHDPLTGVLNRSAFDQALADELLIAAEGDPIVVMLLDLDGFKPINDTYGHAAGDAVLVQTA